MMTKERRKELESIADEDPHMCLLRELLNEIAELEARAVVVPEPTGRDLQEMAAEMRIDGDLVDFLAGASKVVLWYRSKIRAIPADRVLGEGMVQVDAARLAALESISAKIESLALGPDGRAWTPLHYREFARGELRAALRANQGGATT